MLTCISRRKIIRYCLVRRANMRLRRSGAPTFGKNFFGFIEATIAVPNRTATSLTSYVCWHFKRRSRCVSTSMTWCSYGHGLFHDLGLITVSYHDGGVAFTHRRLASPLNHHLQHIACGDTRCARVPLEAKSKSPRRPTLRSNVAVSLRSHFSRTAEA